MERFAKVVLDAAFSVHTALGPGLLESVYEACLIHEIRKQALRTEAQIPLPIVYDGLTLEGGLRLDLLVEDSLIVEIKSVDALHSLHSAQALTYLKLSGRRLALLINFNVPKLKEGIKRIVL